MGRKKKNGTKEAEGKKARHCHFITTALTAQAARKLGVYMAYLGNFEGLNFTSVPHMWPSAEINKWPTPIYSCCWSVHFLIEYAYFELVVLKTCTKNQYNDFFLSPKI
jgi:hypothetical protein